MGTFVGRQRMTGWLAPLRWFIDTVRLAPADRSWLPGQHTWRFRWGRSPATGEPAAPSHLLRPVEPKLPDAAVDDLRCHPGPAPGDQSRLAQSWPDLANAARPSGSPRRRVESASRTAEHMAYYRRARTA